MSNYSQLFELVRNPGADVSTLDDQFPFYPLNAPGMPLPGPNFEAHARQLGDNPPFTIEGKGKEKRVGSYGANLHYLYRRALYDSLFHLPVTIRGQVHQASFVPGHMFGDDTINFNGGPREARVMLIGKQPGIEEVNQRLNFVGPASEDLHTALDQLGIGDAERNDWYVTNVVKFPNLDRQSDGMAKAWVNDCAILLQQELRLVRPEYILCLGSDASKILLGGHAGVENMTGRVEQIYIPLHDAGEEPRFKTAKVMTVTHPAAVARRPELFEAFKDQLSLFVQLTHGADVGGYERDIDHRVVYKESQLRRIVDAVIADPSRWFIAGDGEWHGDHPSEPGSYLRSVQFSTKHGEGVTVVLRHQGGTPAFKPSIAHGVAQLKRLFTPTETYRPRLGGWFFRADMPWLLHEGIDVRPFYRAAPTPELSRTEGGWEGSLMYHATNEAASFKLEDVAARLTTVPRYDKRLAKWKEQYCKVNRIKSKDLEGYGMCPDWVLYATDGTPNYASYDPDATRRIAVRCMEEGGLLDRDWFGNSSWQAYWNAHRASLAVLEMEMNGITLDKPRVDELTTLFFRGNTALINRFRQLINWPLFNPGSAPQCVAFLFGDRYAYRIEKETGQRIPIRPPTAMTLNLPPIKSTGKRSKMWEQIVARGEEAFYTPSSDKEVLGIIGHAHPLAMMLRDIKFTGQALKSVLRPPQMDEANNWDEDDDGYIYEKGLAGSVHSDGKVRTHISQTKETRRYASYREPLQNLSKRREDDFARIFGKWETDKETKQLKPKGSYLDLFPQPMYEHPIRSILKASPGHVLVEADYTGAELAVIAWLANDPLMIDHVRRNNLPESHPDHYDIHSRQACEAFHLTCPPTKTGLKKAGHLGKRVAAKNVNFGVPYGRTAIPIQRQCREEGVDISEGEAQILIDAYFRKYERVTAFLAACQGRVTDPQHLCTPFGGRRRFVRSNDRSVIGEQQRQAMNFPIQSTVADAVNRALDNFWMFRIQHPEIIFRFLLQIHDAILFEVPIAHVRRFAHNEVDEQGRITRPSVLQECMIDRVDIWPCDLDGRRIEGVTEPYHLGIGCDIQLNWGEDITKKQAEELGLDPVLIHD